MEAVRVRSCLTQNRMRKVFPIMLAAFLVISKKHSNGSDYICKRTSFSRSVKKSSGNSCGTEYYCNDEEDTKAKSFIVRYSLTKVWLSLKLNV